MQKHYLSLVSNFKDENPYLKEWIDFHLSVGVDHMYLFDQCGSQESKDILAPYIQNNSVTVHDWTNLDEKYDGHKLFFQKDKNHLGYMHAAQKYRKSTEWLLKIDVDEFLFMADDNYTIKDWLKTLDYKSIKTVRIPRIDFGPSGHLTKPKGGVLENYTQRELEPSNYKDLANAHYLNDNKFCYSSHRWSYKLFPRGKMMELTGSDGLRINHYYTKSKKEYFDRQNIARGRKISEEDFKKITDRASQVFDDKILRQ